MNLCPRCGGTHEGSACPPRDVPREEALKAVVTIEQKINRTRFRDVPVARWVQRGGIYGLVAAVFLTPIVVGILIVNAAGQSSGSFLGEFLSNLAIVLPGASFGCLLVGAALSVIVMGVIRPIYVALFRSIDDWEQEYGDRRPRLPPLGPSARDAG